MSGIKCKILHIKTTAKNYLLFYILYNMFNKITLKIKQLYKQSQIISQS